MDFPSVATCPRCESCRSIKVEMLDGQPINCLGCNLSRFRLVDKNAEAAWLESRYEVVWEKRPLYLTVKGSRMEPSNAPPGEALLQDKPVVCYLKTGYLVELISACMRKGVNYELVGPLVKVLNENGVKVTVKLTEE